MTRASDLVPVAQGDAMTQHTPPTDAELAWLRSLLDTHAAARAATDTLVTATPGTDGFERFAEEDDAAENLASAAVAALPGFLAELTRLRAAPLGYDAALKVAEAVRDACADEMVRTGGFNPDLHAIARATLGDDAVARAKEAVVEAATEALSVACVDNDRDPRRVAIYARYFDSVHALLRAREEAGKRG